MQQSQKLYSTRFSISHQKENGEDVYWKFEITNTPLNALYSDYHSETEQKDLIELRCRLISLRERQNNTDSSAGFNFQLLNSKSCSHHYKSRIPGRSSA